MPIVEIGVRFRRVCHSFLAVLPKQAASRQPMAHAQRQGTMLDLRPG
ncbi:MAG: hypothetical protein MUC44_02790 [Beijerinckiaceae bacterium]|jgi:hypothetical protein|nr:hypothetical protein [Beijerinckiaceae bacterium]